MRLQQKIMHELKELGLTTAYFASWLGLLIALKELILAEYNIRFHGFSLALVGALVLSKVVLILEHVPLGLWLEKRPAILDVVLRAILYAVGVFGVILCEKAFESRHEHGGFGAALLRVFQHRDMPHVWANTICIAFALLGFNVLSVLRRHLGERGLMRVFFSIPVPREAVADHKRACSK